eukprot:m.247031 g.247031  ORF g.247031 m.247031 type:complete len:145 (+) comp16125_c1_seq1:25-459(+)
MVKTLLKQGAEGRIYKGKYIEKSCIVKERFSKRYRHPALDAKLNRQRMNQEVRAIKRCKKIGIKTPEVYGSDDSTGKIFMEDLTKAKTLRDHLLEHVHDYSQQMGLMSKIGEILGKMHSNNIIHGDLTTSNMMLDENSEIIYIY